MLYLVATPIGNLGDIPQRAIEVLRSVDMIAAEDTRHTGKLLARLGIKTRRITYHEHNERKVAPQLIERLRAGADIALVSDAGTPGISDPGFHLVRLAIQADIEMTMIPGATALVPALVLSGLPVAGFLYRGFPPRKPGKRKSFLGEDVALPHTLIYYESPYRIAALIADALAVFGDRPAALANDLTKLHETVRRGRLSGLAALLDGGGLKSVGEFVLLVAGVGVSVPHISEPPDSAGERNRPV